MNHATETQRLSALKSYDIIDADISGQLDGLVELASSICEAPISLVNLLDEARQVTKARRGLDITDIAREDSFCQHTIMGEGLMVVEDARSDVRFKDNPLVTGDPNIRFYAGMPLKSAGGHNLGAVCLIDREPRRLSGAQKQALRLIAEEVSARLELIKSTHALQQKHKALKESDLFIQNSSDVQAIVDPHGGRIIYINEEALALCGCPRADLIGARYGWQIPDDRLRGKVQDLLGQTDRPEGSLITPVSTGTGRRHYLAHSFTLHEGRWYVTARDVTDEVNARKRAEKAEHEAREEQRFSRLLIKNLPDAFWLIDKGGNVADWNDHLEQVSGFSGEEIRDRFILDFFAGDQRAQLQEALSEIFTEGKATAEGTLITKDGAEIPHALTGIKFTYHGEPYIAGIGVNIKELIDHKNELEKKQQQLSRAQEIAQMGSWQMTFDDMILSWSDQMYELFGLSRDDFNLTFGSFLERVPEEERSGLQQDLQDAMAGKLDGEIEHRITTAEGDIRHVVQLGEVDCDGEGHPVRVRGIMQDITERKEAQLQLQQWLQEKDMLLAEIHHRVKNNLAIISGLLELEAYRTDQPDTRRVLENNTMRIKSMAVVHEMLYQTDDFNTLNFTAFVPNVIEAIKGAHPPKGQEITFEIDVDDITLNVNQAIPCGLIINELVTNAYQHGFEGGSGGHITVALAESPAGISLQVSDSGDGLPADFTPDGGSLGFTLIKALTKQLSGDFSYTSEPVTSFSLTFEKRDGKGSASALPAGYAP